MYDAVAHTRAGIRHTKAAAANAAYSPSDADFDPSLGGVAKSKPPPPPALGPTGEQMLGLTHSALRFLLQQFPGANANQE